MHIKRFFLADISCAAVLFIASTLAAAQGPNTCDELAGSPHDPGRVSAGVIWDRLDPVDAIPACRAATIASPRSGRAWFQYGRALERANQLPQAIDAYRRGSELDYASALNNLGELYRDAKGVTRDLTRAEDLFDRAAKLGSSEGASNLRKLKQAANSSPPRSEPSTSAPANINPTGSGRGELGPNSEVVFNPKTPPLYVSESGTRYWPCDGFVDKSIAEGTYVVLVRLSEAEGIAMPMKQLCRWSIAKVNFQGATATLYSVKYYISTASMERCVAGHCTELREMTIHPKGMQFWIMSQDKRVSRMACAYTTKNEFRERGGCI
jgi:hypothetical protein